MFPKDTTLPPLRHPYIQFITLHTRFITGDTYSIHPCIFHEMVGWASLTDMTGVGLYLCLKPLTATSHHISLSY